MKKIRVHVWISGRVQGVFFRDSTRKEAQTLQVSGWVKNCHDGRVEAVFEGDEELVEKIVAWCHHGPSYASVSEVEIVREEFKNEFGTFSVLFN